jgi:calcineurin-like phosphoesterase family protein
MSRVMLITDTHFNHEMLKTYCIRPLDFTETILKRWRERVMPDDVLIHLGDVIMGKRSKIAETLAGLPGKKILVRGNHDWNKSSAWWMANGFDFACDGLILNQTWLTHEPAGELPPGCRLNIHGHLHTFENQHHDYVARPFHRLLAIEYTEYCPVEMEEFLSHPEKYKALVYQKKGDS